MHISPNARTNSNPGTTFGQTVQSGTSESGETYIRSTTPVIHNTKNVGTYTAAHSATRVRGLKLGAAHAAASGTMTNAAP